MSDDANLAEFRSAQAHLFLAQRQLASGNAARVRELLRKCAGDGPPRSFEQYLAVSELKRLK